MVSSGTWKLSLLSWPPRISPGEMQESSHLSGGSHSSLSSTASPSPTSGIFQLGLHFIFKIPMPTVSFLFPWQLAAYKFVDKITYKCLMLLGSGLGIGFTSRELGEQTQEAGLWLPWFCKKCKTTHLRKQKGYSGENCRE